jgi:hypothetical protein
MPSQNFFALVQNKMHWAAHGHTAAEVVHSRANAAKPNMGLTTWKNAPRGAIRKTDVAVAKNYLTQDEITELNRIVTMYLDFAEDQARRHVPMHMKDWIGKLDAFLEFNGRDILKIAGKISHELAEEHAFAQFEQFQEQQRKFSDAASTDFDLAVEKIKLLPKTTETKKKRNPRKLE